LNVIAIQEDLTESEKVNLLISFVQSLPYTFDNVSTPFDEYPRFPIETLVFGGGDCEDTSILTSALLYEMGYDVILINPPGHMAVGINIEAARVGGIRVGSTIVLTMFVSGALAGLAGAVQLCGVYHRVLPAMTANIGYNSILVALLGNLSILGSILASILFSSLIVGADTMYYLTGISRYLVFFIQGLIILFVISGDKLLSDEQLGSIRQKIFSKVK